MVQHGAELPAGLDVEEPRRAVVAGRREHRPVGAEGQDDDLAGILPQLIQQRAAVRVPDPYGAGMTTRYDPRAPGVEGDGGDRINMARAAPGVDLGVAAEIPQPGASIPAAHQHAPTVAAEDGPMDGGIQGPEERARVAQGGHVPEPGRPGRGPPGQEP